MRKEAKIMLTAILHKQLNDLEPPTIGNISKIDVIEEIARANRICFKFVRDFRKKWYIKKRAVGVNRSKSL